jgi:hypothetical protein
VSARCEDDLGNGRYLDREGAEAARRHEHGGKMRRVERSDECEDDDSAEHQEIANDDYRGRPSNDGRKLHDRGCVGAVAEQR